MDRNVAGLGEKVQLLVTVQLHSIFAHLRRLE